MGRVIDMLLPRLGETMDEGRIGLMFKQPGDAFRRGETLLEVESDKTTVEVPALQDGVLVEWLVTSDQKVPVDSAIARIAVAGEAAAAVVPIGVTATEPSAPRTPGPPPAARPAAEAPRPRASTAARAEARRRGIDLARITGTGRAGRIQRADLALRPARLSGHVATAQGDIFVRDWAAQGPQHGVALLLHGLFSDSQSFATVGRLLAARGLRVLAPDLPGHGESRSDATSLDALAAAMLAVAPPGPLHLVGHSLGAIIATELASRAASLTLLAPAGCGAAIHAAFIAAMLAGDVDRALAAMGEGDLPAAPRAALAALLAARRDQLAAIAAWLVREGGQQRSILPRLAALGVPVTAVFQRDDPVIPAQQALDLPANVAVRFLAGRSHMPHWHAPELVAAIVSAAA